jgi:hypothetical protein
MDFLYVCVCVVTCVMFVECTWVYFLWAGGKEFEIVHLGIKRLHEKRDTWHIYVLG